MSRETLQTPPADRTSLPAKRVLTKLFFLILLSAHPVWFCVMLSVQFIKTEYNIRVDMDGDAAPDESARYEQAARDAIQSVLTEKYDLKAFDVKYTRPGWYAGGRRICDAGGKTERALRLKIVVPQGTHRFEIAEDVARIKRETPGLPQCPYVLEFSYPILGIAAIVIPDAMSGYNGRKNWDIGNFSPWDGFFSINWETRK